MASSESESDESSEASDSKHVVSGERGNESMGGEHSAAKRSESLPRGPSGHAGGHAALARERDTPDILLGSPGADEEHNNGGGDSTKGAMEDFALNVDDVDVATAVHAFDMEENPKKVPATCCGRSRKTVLLYVLSGLVFVQLLVIIWLLARKAPRPEARGGGDGVAEVDQATLDLWMRHGIAAHYAWHLKTEEEAKALRMLTLKEAFKKEPGVQQEVEAKLVAATAKEDFMQEVADVLKRWVDYKDKHFARGLTSDATDRLLIISLVLPRVRAPAVADAEVDAGAGTWRIKEFDWVEWAYKKLCSSTVRDLVLLADRRYKKERFEVQAQKTFQWMGLSSELAPEVEVWPDPGEIGMKDTVIVRRGLAMEYKPGEVLQELSADSKGHKLFRLQAILIEQVSVFDPVKTFKSVASWSFGGNDMGDVWEPDLVKVDGLAHSKLLQQCADLDHIFVVFTRKLAICRKCSEALGVLGKFSGYFQEHFGGIAGDGFNWLGSKAKDVGSKIMKIITLDKMKAGMSNVKSGIKSVAGKFQTE